MWQPGNNPYHLWQPQRDLVVGFLTSSLDLRIVHDSVLPDGYLSFAVIAVKADKGDSQN